MDPLSLAASVFAVVITANEVAKGLSKLADSKMRHMSWMRC
jgi:hypothetical protein